MTKLLTQQDLAERWQVDVSTITNWRKEGILQPIKGIPAIRFTEEHIAELEGVKLERFSPLERRKIESELEELRLQNEKLKEVLGNILTESSKVINLI
ncbi:helix-turn-helix domain-containing protein [Tissierella carlieri]|uniref:helix-turn-helix domain-containing protein n=1 Tax=Tissierella carlieri TaxID=689904 RepID=UPI001C11D722|nr:helix-turn-helix domain-containing protein [Tissierella carlieri]MBU5312304.1 helix-turn-helix domain-containing protein [Tissierella carlieri]